MAAGRILDDGGAGVGTSLLSRLAFGARAGAGERAAPALADASDAGAPTGGAAPPAPEAPPKPQAPPPQAPPQAPAPAALPSFLNLPAAAAARAERALAGLTPAVAAGMTEAELSAALKHLHAKHQAAGTRPAGDEAAALNAIYAALPDDPAFLADDTRRRDALVERIMASPFIRDTGTRWAHRDRAGREGTVREVVHAAAQAYGIRNPPRVEFRALEGSVGRYDERTNTVIIDPASDLFKRGKDLRGTIVSAAVEEAVHAYQWRLIQDRWHGRMDASDPRFRQAELFLLNGNGNILYLRTPEDRHGYRGQPMERHAKAVAEEIKRTLSDYDDKKWEETLREIREGGG